MDDQDFSSVTPEQFSPLDFDKQDQSNELSIWPQGNFNNHDDFELRSRSSSTVMGFSPFLVDEGMPMEFSALSSPETLLSSEIFGEIEIGNDILWDEKSVSTANEQSSIISKAEEYKSYLSESGAKRSKSSVTSEDTYCKQHLADSTSSESSTGFRIAADTLRPKSEPNKMYTTKLGNENGTSQLSQQMYSSISRDSNSKNAIAARDNRLKKKRYVAGLEESVRNLSTENHKLLKECNKSKEQVASLQNEIKYLRSVIANQSTLSALLKSVVQTPGISLSTSFSGTAGSKGKKRLIKKDNGSVDLIHHNRSSRSDASELISPSGRVLRSCKTQKTPEVLLKSSVKQWRKCKNVTSAKKRKKENELHLNFDKKYDQERNVIVDVEDSESDSDSFFETRSNSSEDLKGGICLHVSGENVSLEFCAQCSSNSNSGILSDHSYVKF